MSAIDDALTLPNGARFHRCALQVNPYPYLVRHGKVPPGIPDEASYNAALVEALAQEGIEVISVTDHYQVSTSEPLRRAAERAGIQVFPGFEAVTKDGVHLLCLFPPDRDIQYLERVLGDCGVHENKTDSPVGQYDVLELLEKVPTWGAIAIAAHVAGAGGLLTKLSGTAAINAWRSADLLACSLPGSVQDATPSSRTILENRNADYRRERPVTILNAQDISSPGDVAKPGASCWVKMSEVSVEGLRQAFLDPASRIRLASDPLPEEHVEFLALAWEGGFLDGVGIHLNENLNVLIGGRGTGKSTIVESVRAVLDLKPLGPDAAKAHEGILKQVLRNGTKISLRVRSHHPSKREYLIERSLPSAPLVKDDTGTVLTLQPLDVVPHVEVYGQHEISELARSPVHLTTLLERFVPRDPALAARKHDLTKRLVKSREDLVRISSDLLDAEEKLGTLPALEEMFARYRDAGLEERLKDQSFIISEEQILSTAKSRIESVSRASEALREAVPLSRDFLIGPEVSSLPWAARFSSLETVLATLTDAVDKALSDLDSAVRIAMDQLSTSRDAWEVERKQPAQRAYERLLRELQREKIDGEEFVRTRRQIEQLRPIQEAVAALRTREANAQAERRQLLAQWEDAKAEEFRGLENATKLINRQLTNRVRVNVAYAAQRDSLTHLLREGVGGRISEALASLASRGDLSVRDLANACRAGAPSLSTKYGIQLSQAERICQAPEELFMKLEELEPPASTTVELNVSADGTQPVWQALDDLSTGQKATAVLLLLLLESRAPLVIDQPEDDLDNRFITDGVVPKMREGKRHRQFVFATHNANIPVLGDAELIVGLIASGEATGGRAVVSSSRLGSIDMDDVRELVEEVLEGGKEAFEMRRLKYGF